MRNLAISSGIWNYAEPANLTPRWVHFDERQVAFGYPLVRQGSRGEYVCILQDVLVGTNTWNALQSQVVGKGASNTTVLPNENNG